MFHKQNSKKRNRRAGLVVDRLEERVVLSTAGSHSVAAEVARATGHGPASTAHFQAVVNRLNNQFQSKLNQLQAGLNASIERDDAKYQPTLIDTVARINTGAIVNAERDAVSLDNASNAVDQEFSTLLAHFDQRLNRFERNFNARLARKGYQGVVAMPALRSAATAVQGNFLAAESAFPNMVFGELQEADNNLQNTFNSVFDAIANYQPPTVSSAGAATAAATTNQPFALNFQSPIAANQVAFNGFVGQLNSNFNTFRTAFATTPLGPFGPIPPFNVGTFGGSSPVTVSPGTTGVSTTGTGTSAVGTVFTGTTTGVGTATQIGTTTGVGTTVGSGTTNGLGTTTGTGTGTTTGTSSV